MNAPIPEDKLNEIKNLVFQGQKINAIKLYREYVPDASLTEAKTEVEKLEAELRAVSPERFSSGPTGKGCMGMVMGFCAIVVVIILWGVCR